MVVGVAQVPAINACIDDATQEIVYKDYCDVSVAVASPKGLVVPVLRNTHTMTFKVVGGCLMAVCGGHSPVAVSEASR